MKGREEGQHPCCQATTLLCMQQRLDQLSSGWSITLTMMGVQQALTLATLPLIPHRLILHHPNNTLIPSLTLTCDSSHS